jgi:hypothetical protein
MLTQLQTRLQYEPIRVSGGNSIIWFVLCALVTVVLCANAWEKRDALSILGAVSFVALSTALLLTLIPRLGKPVLTVRREGLEFPTFGLIPWQAIDSMNIQELESRHGSLGYMLNVEVPSLPERTAQMHPATRLLYRTAAFGKRRTLISTRLVATSVPADSLWRLIQELWKQ